jgi:hypothetical protein
MAIVSRLAFPRSSKTMDVPYTLVFALSIDADFPGRAVVNLAFGIFDAAAL